jgi:dihydroorotate dehydrogenase electron transfer subunit
MPSDTVSLGGRDARREQLPVVANEAVGPYTLLRLERGGLDPGVPGQFFMLEAPGRVLPRPMSLCQAPPGELTFLMEAVGPGTRALCGLEPGEAIHVLGPLGNGFDLDVARPLLVAGGIGIAPMPYVLDALGGDVPAILGFRTDHHAEAAHLLPNARVVVEPRLVTELLHEEPHDVLACGPEPMLEAVRALAPAAQLAWEAPMACGYGACYGCVVERDGRYVRLCVDGPVLKDAA